jgi:hypothetical protein
MNAPSNPGAKAELAGIVDLVLIKEAATKKVRIAIKAEIPTMMENFEFHAVGSLSGSDGNRFGSVVSRVPVFIGFRSFSVDGMQGGLGGQVAGSDN